MAAEGCNLHHRRARRRGAERSWPSGSREQHGVKVTVHRSDLGQIAEVEALGKGCADVDILVNNAGDIPPGTLGGDRRRDLAQGLGRQGLRLCRSHAASSIRTCARARAASSSTSSAPRRRTPNHRYIAGCMANIALNMFTQCLGGESMRHGVRVVAINPGPTVPGRHLPHVMARAKRLLGDENRWPELHAKLPAGRAGQSLGDRAKRSCSLPPTAPASSAAPPSTSTAATPVYRADA